MYVGFDTHLPNQGSSLFIYYVPREGYVTTYLDPSILQQQHHHHHQLEWPGRSIDHIVTTYSPSVMGVRSDFQ